MAETVGLLRRHDSYAIWRRHPLAFLVEAADDICYHVIDIEDGYRLGRLGYAEAQELFWPLIADPQREGRRLAQIGGTREKVEFLRAKVINHVIQQVVGVFLELKNAKENGAGQSLPAGVMRVYKKEQFRQPAICRRRPH